LHQSIQEFLSNCSTESSQPQRKSWKFD